MSPVCHQTEALGGRFLRHFGLEGAADRSPLRGRAPAAGGGGRSGSSPGCRRAIPRSAGRSPTGSALIRKALPEQAFTLFGTAGDAPLAAEVAAGFEPTRSPQASPPA